MCGNFDACMHAWCGGEDAAVRYICMDVDGSVLHSVGIE